MTNLLATIITASALLITGCATKPKEPTVQWIGNPALRTGDNFFPNVGWLPDYEFGFREDGVMVWREVKKEKSK